MNRVDSPGGVLLGIARLARGRKDGLAQFRGTEQAFLASLAPLIAFPLVGGLLMLAGGGGLRALSDMLATFCALLAPPVLSYELARLWRREAEWLRYATAFNWCQWAIPVAAMILLIIVGTAAAMGVPETAAGVGFILVLCAYGIWLHWFIARHGLGLSRLRAVLLVLGVNIGTAALVLGPRLLAGSGI